MKISNIAWSNFKGNLYRYIMYYLSNAFAVGAFFIFVNFLLHPNVDFRNLGGHYFAQAGAINGIIMSLVVIVLFSIMFVGYSTSVFLKARGKEFGLLSLYGMTKNQIRQYVFIENSIISIISIVSGIVFGAFFSKLFFMVMESLVGVALPFNISFLALGITLILFFVLFEFISFIMLANIRDKVIVEQLKSAKMPKELRPASKRKALWGVGLLLLGYGLAWIANGAFVVLLMIPVTTIVIIGTKLFFSEFSMYLGERLSKNEKFKYKKNNLVVVSQIVYKLQDTAKVLFIASILGAITFTATETVYSFYTEVPGIQGFSSVDDIALLRDGDNLNDPIIEKIRSKIGESSSKIKFEREINLLKAYNPIGEEKKNISTHPLLISNSEFNKLIEENKSFKEEEFQLARGEVVFNFPHRITEFNGRVDKSSRLERDDIKLSVGPNEIEFKVKKEIFGEFFSNMKVGQPNIFILNDQDFQELYEKSSDEFKAVYNGIQLKKLNKSYDLSISLLEEMGADYEDKVFFKAIPKVENNKAFAMILFIGFFISFLFFIATGSIIYFKLFNELESDRREYGIMSKIGTSELEIKSIITKQIAIIFFLPFIVSTCHSFFALKSLANLLRANLVMNGLTIMGVYAVFQIGYFFIIRRSYLKRVFAK